MLHKVQHLMRKPKIWIAVALVVAMGGVFWLRRSPKAASAAGTAGRDGRGGSIIAPAADSQPAARSETPAVSLALNRSEIGAVPGSPTGLVYRSASRRPPGEIAFLQSLKPRTAPPKESLVIPAGKNLRLHIKLIDAAQGRATADGRLAVEEAGAPSVQALARLVLARGLRCRRLHTVSDEALRTLERRAAERTGVAQPDLGGMVEVVVPGGSRDEVVAVAKELHALPEVEYAELESLDLPPPPPAIDIAPTTPLWTASQEYRGSATGVNVDHVWNSFSIRGHPSLQVIDCEYMFNPNHEDLSDLVQIQSGVVSMYSAFGDDHGTAVQGVLFGGFNEYGVSGSAPECAAWFYPEFATMTSGSQSRVACVTAALAASAYGDLVVLEMQTTGALGGYGPAEYNLSLFNVVKTGTDAGVIVVAAAGNGAEDLDHASYADYRGRGDSGAIIVGAGNASRQRQSYSTYGSRVNVQGWGGSVVTTGYGSLATYGGDPNQEYASGFSGTSSATAVVASAAALLQSVAIELCEMRIAPAEMRSLLSSTGRAQTGDVTRSIGPLPELHAAVDALLAAHPPQFSTLRSWALFHFGDPNPVFEQDPDGDGASSLLEYVAGTDPKSNTSGGGDVMPRISIDRGGDGSHTVVFEFRNPPGRTGAAWKVQHSPDLASGSWGDLVIGENGVTGSRSGDVFRVFIASDGTEEAGFYRLHITAP